jgi:DNA topoisomerase-2
LKPVEDIEKTLKLTRVMGTNNMNLFDADERLCKYETVQDILDAFYKVRHTTYLKRKVHQEAVLERTLHKLTHKVKYIRAILADTLDLRRKTQDEIVKALQKLKIEEHDGYNYLIKMPMDSVTDENVKHLLSDRDSKRAQHKQLTDTSIQALWTRDLDELEQEYKKWATAAEAMSTSGSGTSGGAAAAKKKMVIKKA